MEKKFKGHTQYVIIEAKYSSKCPVTGDPIDIGDLCIYDMSRKKVYSENLIDKFRYDGRASKGTRLYRDDLDTWDDNIILDDYGY